MQHLSLISVSAVAALTAASTLVLMNGTTQVLSVTVPANASATESSIIAAIGTAVAALPGVYSVAAGPDSLAIIRDGDASVDTLTLTGTVNLTATAVDAVIPGLAPPVAAPSKVMPAVVGAVVGFGASRLLGG